MNVVTNAARIVMTKLFIGCFRLSRAPRGRAARVALQARAVAPQGKIPALAASLSRKTFHPRLAALFGDGRPLGGGRPFEPAEFRFDLPLEVAFERRRGVRPG